MDDDELEKWLVQSEDMISEMLQMQLTLEQMSEFLLERGIDLEAGTLEAEKGFMVVAALATVYTMAHFDVESTDWTLVRTFADSTVSDLGEDRPQAWDDLLDHFFGGEKTGVTIDSERKQEVARRYDEYLTQVLSLVFEMGHTQNLSPQEVELVTEFIMAMNLMEEGIEPRDLQELLRLKVMNSDLDREFWMQMIDLIFM